MTEMFSSKCFKDWASSLILIFLSIHLIFSLSYNFKAVYFCYIFFWQFLVDTGKLQSFHKFADISFASLYAMK